MISSRSCSLESSETCEIRFSLALSMSRSISGKITPCTCRKIGGQANENKHKLRSRSMWRVNSCVSQTHVSLTAHQIDYVRFTQLISFVSFFFCLPVNLFQLLIALDYARVDWKMKCRVSDLRQVTSGASGGKVKKKSRRRILNLIADKLLVTRHGKFKFKYFPASPSLATLQHIKLSFKVQRTLCQHRLGWRLRTNSLHNNFNVYETLGTATQLAAELAVVVS